MIDMIDKIMSNAIANGPQNGDKCLSVKQPFASLIVEGFKPFENRTWTTAYRGPVWIHASKRAFTDWQEFLLTLGLLPDDVEEIEGSVETTGAIIGVAWLEAIYAAIDMPREHTGNTHAEGPYCWHFTESAPVEPVPMKGKLNLFEFKS